MLEHQKKVIEGVSKNTKLFSNELEKSVTWLNTEDLIKLKGWAESRFGETHKEILNRLIPHQKETSLNV